MLIAGLTDCLTAPCCIKCEWLVSWKLETTITIVITVILIATDTLAGVVIGDFISSVK